MLEPLTNPGAPIDLTIGALELSAFSISGLATYVLVPSFDACFDLGHCAVEAVKLRHVFLTHAHQDHAGGAHRHLSVRRMFGMSPSKIFIPAESAEGLREVFRAWDRVEDKPTEPELDQIITGVAAGDEVKIGNRYVVRAFDVVHRIVSRGWTVVERKPKLRAAYQELPGAEIHAARQRGEVVSDLVETAVFTFIGDSTIETLRRHPEVFASQVLFLEATHVGRTDAAVSLKYGHTHLDELAALYLERPETFGAAKIVLKHFSTRYGREEILRAVQALPEGLRQRVITLV